MYKVKKKIIMFQKCYYVTKITTYIIAKLQNKLKNQHRGRYKRPENRPNVRFETTNSQF